VVWHADSLNVLGPDGDAIRVIVASYPTAVLYLIFVHPQNSLGRVCGRNGQLRNFPELKTNRGFTLELHIFIDGFPFKIRRTDDDADLASLAFRNILAKNRGFSFFGPVQPLGVGTNNQE
jgi:hypothetical protein